MKQHTMEDDGTGYKSHHRQDLFVSDDRNFRPVDMEFAPDGSLYFIDWHNVLIGHMQHNARDPLRDHKLGRIYRSEEHTSELQSLMRISYAVFRLKKKRATKTKTRKHNHDTLQNHTQTEQH